jgi:hypothetical protein
LVPRHLLWVHHRAGSITESTESFLTFRLWLRPTWKSVVLSVKHYHLL